MAELSPSAAPVVGLFKPRGPAAIVGGIISIVVDAVERVSARWARAHVSKKQNEIMPTLADRNPPSAIVFEALIFRIAAAREHAGPDIVLRQAVRLSVCETSRAGYFSLKASARFGAAVSKIAACRETLATTIAETLPQLIFVSESDQATETLAGNFNKLWHRPILAQPYIGVNWPRH